MSASGQKTILVVEDELDEVAYLTVLFEDHGFRVISATNGQAGYEKAATLHPDLITLDISMPAESGVRTFVALQENPATADIPVVIITGLSQDFERFVETHPELRPPAACFDKPPDRRRLIGKIEAILVSGSGYETPQLGGAAE